MPTFGGAIQFAYLPGSHSGFISEAIKSPSALSGNHWFLDAPPIIVADDIAIGIRFDARELTDLSVKGDVRQRQLEIDAGLFNQFVPALDATGRVLGVIVTQPHVDGRERRLIDQLGPAIDQLEHRI